jgi:iron(III) transport system substrate-binding protein
MTRRSRLMRISRIVTQSLVILLFGLLSESGCYPTQAEDLTILSPHWEGLKYEYAEAFQQHLGKTVNIRWLDVGGTSDILRYIEASAQDTSAPPADLIFGGGTLPFQILAGKNLLLPLEFNQAILAGLPSRLHNHILHDPGKTWYAAMLSTFGILCNKDVLARLTLPAPQSWHDLADPRLHSWIGVADPRKSGSAHMVYEIILQAHGWDEGWKILQGIAKNTRGFAAGSSELPHAVLVGDVACAIVIDSYASHIMASLAKPILSFHVPQGLSPITGDAIAVLRQTKNPELAEKFVTFVLSDAGQQILAYRPGDPRGPRKHLLLRLSVRPSIYEIPEATQSFFLNPFTTTQRFIFEEGLASSRWAFLNDIMGVFLIENEIVETDPLQGAPVSSAKALTLASEWNDPSVRLDMIAQWKRAATADKSHEHKVSVIEAISILFFGALFVVALISTLFFRQHFSCLSVIFLSSTLLVEHLFVLG